jgi:hypothetical protein
MRLAKILRYSVILSLFVVLAGAGRGWAAPVVQDKVWVITYPTEGSTLSGTVNIQGTVTHPNFASYGILYAAGTRVAADTGWRLDDPIVWDVKSMVVNGVLGTWDTTTVPNGQYMLALVVYEAGNDTPNAYFINNLTIQNEEATPTPEPTLEPTPTELAATPPPGEGVAPVAPTIEQPPTATPRPTPTINPNATPTTETDGEKTPKTIISVDNIKETFIAGAQLAVLMYVFGGLYIAAKAAIRYFLREQRRKQRP